MNLDPLQVSEYRVVCVCALVFGKDHEHGPHSLICRQWYRLTCAMDKGAGDQVHFDRCHSHRQLLSSSLVSNGSLWTSLAKLAQNCLSSPLVTLLNVSTHLPLSFRLAWPCSPRWWPWVLSGRPPRTLSKKWSGRTSSRGERSDSLYCTYHGLAHACIQACMDGKRRLLGSVKIVKMASCLIVLNQRGHLLGLVKIVKMASCLIVLN